MIIHVNTSGAYSLTDHIHLYLLNTLPGQSGVHVFGFHYTIIMNHLCKFNKLFSLCVLVNGMNNEWKEETKKKL